MLIKIGEKYGYLITRSAAGRAMSDGNVRSVVFVVKVDYDSARYPRSTRSPMKVLRQQSASRLGVYG